MNTRYGPYHVESVTRSAYWRWFERGVGASAMVRRPRNLFSSVHHLHELHTAVHADLRVDAVRVILDGLKTDEQLLGDLFVRLSEADFLHDLPLALRYAVMIENVLQALLGCVLGLDGREH